MFPDRFGRTVEVSGMSDENDVQDWEVLIAGRALVFVDAALIVAGDVLQDGGLMKVVEGAELVEDGSSDIAVSFVEGTAGGRSVTYFAGRPALVWRLPDDG
jgi:hypothetical protein